VTDQRLTDELAARVLRWRLAPDRYIKSGRSWIPRWRFRPLEELGDAFQLLEAAASGYTLALVEGGPFTAAVQVHGRMGQASGESRARTITIAICRALGLELPDDVGGPVSMPARSRRAGGKTDGL
jgi:hypothetical protein